MKSSHFIFTIIAILGVTACKQTTTKDAIKEHISYNALQYTEAVSSSNVISTSLTGKVTYNEDQIIVYKPISEGIVHQTFFSTGDYVKKGQKLLTVRSDSFNELQTELKSAQDELSLATRNLRKAENMFEDKLLSEQELLEAKIEFNRASDNLAKQQAAIKMYGNDVGKGLYQVNAQTNGYIFSKKASPSSTITPDEEVYTLGKLDNLWIMANIYTKSINLLIPGEEVTITSPIYPNKVFKGKIDRILPFIDSEERVMKARIEFINEDALLKPDFIVDIKVQDVRLNNIPAIPTECLIFDNNRFYVVAKTNGSLAIKPVEIFKQDDKQCLIKEGIEIGDSILCENQLLYYTQLNQ